MGEIHFIAGIGFFSHLLSPYLHWTGTLSGQKTCDFEWLHCIETMLQS